MPDTTRRQFLKAAAVAGGIAAVPSLFIRKAGAQWARKSIIHPNINNARVVALADPRMTKAKQPVATWSRQEELVELKFVWENIDRLACALTETRNPEEAWRAIFVRPPQKSWSDTVVAVKTNHMGTLQHTRSAVLSKICAVLTKQFQIKPHNIHIYDAADGASMEKTPFRGLPQGCRIEGDWGGITTSTLVPEPWKDGGGRSKCLKHLVNGSIDILINVALCKGHNDVYGGFSMTMKNHLGTFAPSPAHEKGALEYLIAVNQTPEILGPMDTRTGKILFPRQQLCLVDALWASELGPSGYPRSQPNLLAMGVLSPVMDYLLATRFRAEKMGWDVNRDAARRMVREFGYDENDLGVGGGWIEI
jgi:hypothetical protein